MKRLRACTAFHLPIELIFTILVKLPAKSLLRFRCVSKRWRDLIHSSTFISMHNLAHKHDFKYLIHENCQSEDSLEKKFFRWYKNCSSRTVEQSYDLTLGESEVLDFSNFFPPGLSYRPFFHGSCDGLVCLSVESEKHNDVLDRKIFLWNPSIKKLKPLSSNNYDNHSLDPFIAHEIGFGLCKGAVDDYKVVAFSYFDDFKRGIIDVYTFSTNSWKRLDVVVDTDITGNWNSSNSVNGALHWVGTKPSMEIVIVVFDLQTEVLGEMMLPKVDCGLLFEGCGCLGNFGGKLSLLSLNSDKIFVWTMKEYGVVESWTKYAAIQFDIPYYEPTWFGFEGCMFFQQYTRGVIMFGTDLDWMFLENDLPAKPNFYTAIDFNESLVLINEAS